MPFCVIKQRFHTILREEARDCVKETIQAYEEKKRLLSMLQAIRHYMVLKITLYNKISRHRDKASYGVIKEGLTLEEKNSIKS